MQNKKYLKKGKCKNFFYNVSILRETMNKDKRLVLEQWRKQHENRLTASRSNK